MREVGYCLLGESERSGYCLWGESERSGLLSVGGE